jgi:DNA replication protein DnaC
MSDEERIALRRERYERQVARENATEGNLQGYNCSTCKNKGYISAVREYDGDFEIIQKTCAVCAKPRRSIANLQRSGLAEVLDKYTFDNFTTDKEWQKDMLAKARAFRTQNKVHCFFIGGNSGAGKTHLCSALAIDYLRHGSEVKYILWRKELREIRRKIFDEGNEGYLDYLKNVDVLYLDDFFKSVKAADDPFQRPTQADANLAFEIISERLDRDRITIISTECTLDELIAIDEATGSRIRRGSEGFATVVRRDRKNNYRMREG